MAWYFGARGSYVQLSTCLGSCISIVGCCMCSAVVRERSCMCGAATLIDPTGWPLLDGVHFVITCKTYNGGSEQCDASFALWGGSNDYV